MCAGQKKKPSSGEKERSKGEEDGTSQMKGWTHD